MAIYNSAFKGGTIGSFSGTTVTVSGFTPAAGDVGSRLVINSGSAKLQHREITGVSGQDITIAHTWDSQPYIDPSSNSRATDALPSNGDTIVVSKNILDLVATDADLTLVDENHLLVTGTLETSNGAYIHANNIHFEWLSDDIDIGRGGGLILGYYSHVAGEDGYEKNICNVVDPTNTLAGNSLRKGTNDYGLFDMYGGEYYAPNAVGCFLRCYENTSAPTEYQVRMMNVTQSLQVGGRQDGNRSMLKIRGVGGKTSVGIGNPLSAVARVEFSATGCDQAGYGNLALAPNGTFVFPQLRDIAVQVLRFTGVGTAGLYTVVAKKAELDLIPVFAGVASNSPNTTLRYGNLLAPTFVDSAGDPLAGTLVTRLYDDTGTSVNDEDVTGGSYTEFFARHTDIILTSGDKDLSDGTLYAPYTLRSIQYGKLFGLSTITVEDSFESAVTVLDDSTISESNQATVDAYPITISEAGGTLTITGDGATIRPLTPQQLYDLCVSYLESNITDEIAMLVSRSGDLIDAGGYNLVLDYIDYTGDITTTGTSSLTNGSSVLGSITDNGGTITTLPYSVPVLVAGSNVQIYNVTKDSEFSIGIEAGTSISGTYTDGVEFDEGDTVEVRVPNSSGLNAYLNTTATVIATSSGWSALLSQELDTIFNLNGKDGSLVTGITLDVPNIEFDLDEADNKMSAQEVYAWYVNELMTEEGLRNIYGAINAESQFRYSIDPAITDLKLDNKDLVNSLLISGGYFFRTDKTAIIASGSGNIEMIPEESYVANSDSIQTDLTSIESKIDVVDSNVDDVLADTNELQANQGNFATATGFSTPTNITDSQSAIQSDIGNLNDVSPAEVQAELVTYGANKVAPDNAGISANGVSVSNLNDISEAQVNTQVDLALSDYDGPTKAELDSAVSPLSTEVNATSNKDAIITQGDAAWVTGSGSSDVNIISVNGVATTNVDDFKATGFAVVGDIPTVEEIDAEITLNHGSGGYETATATIPLK